MADTPHLQKRGNVYHYYRRVPLRLVPILGRRFIKRSLGTTNLAEAKTLRTVEDLKAEALFAAAETAHPKVGSSGVSFEMLVEYVRETVERLDRRSAESLAFDPPADMDELQERSQDAEYQRSILANPADPRRDELVSRAADRIMSDAGVSVSGQGLNAQFAEIVRRGLIELTRRKVDRLEDRHDRPFHDNLFDPARPPAVTFRELADMYVAEKEQDHDVNGVSQKRTDKVKAIVETICEIVGDSTVVHSIDDDVVQRARSLLSKTPSNRTKRYSKLTLEQAIERAAKQNKPTLSPVTQSFYLDILREILKVAVRKKLLPSNPASDVKPLKKDTLSAEQKRLPWKPEQLKGFFTGKFYQSCAPGALKPYAKPDRAWRYWLPLIMLFSGARPNEIAQLLIADLKRTPKGTWYLDLDDEDGKALKTETSRRRVPLHPELIRLGFVAFVEERRKAAAKMGPRLFHELKPDQYNNFAWYAARRLNEFFIPAEITLGDRQSLYSLRHNVRDALRRVKAPAETLLAVCGWSPSGKAVSDDYGDPGDPDLHAEAVAQISYPDLDLSFLHVT